MTVHALTPTEWLGALATAVGLILGLATLGGLLVRYALLPWLREHIVTPLGDTRRQVTVNGHVSSTPTLLDRVDTVAHRLRATLQQLDTVEAKVDDNAERVNATATMLDGHLDRSAGEWGRLWDSIYDVREHVGLPRQPTTERIEPRHE